MLSDKERKVVELTVEGKTSKSDIAKLLGVSRTMVYNYLDKQEVQAEIARCLNDIRTQSEQKIVAQIEPVIEELYRIALTGGTRERKDACIYLINRVLGTPKALLDIDDKREDNTDVDILAAFDSVVGGEDGERKE